MNLLHFLETTLSNNQSGDWSVLCFKGKKYPLLFFSQFFTCWKQLDESITQLNLDDIELKNVFAELSTSFLGQNKIFWCKDTGRLDKSKRQKFYEFSASYQGPHKLLFFSEEGVTGASSSLFLTIDCDANIDSKDYQKIYSQFYAAKPVKAMSNFAKMAFSAGADKNGGIELDIACQLMRYEAAVENDLEEGTSHELCTKWLDKIIAPAKSLFTLSQYFFSKDRKRFMRYWNSVEGDFPPEFWTVYWSEQLWQATMFMSQVDEFGPVGARKGINRLPFSFTQKDWRKYTKRELVLAHNFLYSIDHGLKNGHASFGLELFFAQFLQSGFAKKQ